RDLHRLLLEKRNAERLLEPGAKLGLGIFGSLLALAAATIGMDHVALDRPRTHDRDPDHELATTPGPEPGQPRHSLAAFDLDTPQCGGPLDHRIDIRVSVLKIGHTDRDALMLGEQVEGAVHAAEHAEPQDVDLHELEDVDIVLVPFDDLPRVHARRLDRH